MSVITEKIGDNIELLIDGLPQSVMTPSTQAKAALMLAKYAIPIGADLAEGVLGGVRVATLKIGRQYYQIKYAVKVLKPLTALEVYSEAIQWIEFQKVTGRADSQLADYTIQYLRKEFRKEFS